MAQLFQLAQTQRLGDAPQQRVDGNERGDRVARDGQQRIQKQGDDGRYLTDAGKGNHQRQQRDGGDRLQQSGHVENARRQCR